MGKATMAEWRLLWIAIIAIPSSPSLTAALHDGCTEFIAANEQNSLPHLIIERPAAAIAEKILATP